MNLPPAASSCPSDLTLSSWLDEELGADESERVRTHLEHCERCREQVGGWVDAAVNARPEPVEGRIPSLSTGSTVATCLDPELLLAYSDGQLSEPDSARAERHLDDCARCVAEVQRLIRLRVALGESPQERPAGVPTETVRPARGARHVLSSIWTTASSAIRRPIAAGGMVAATALLLLVAAQWLPLGGGETSYRGLPAETRVEIVADRAAARARPAKEEAIVVVLTRGTVARRLEAWAGWLRIELPDGRRVWVEGGELRPLPTESAP